MHASSRVLGLFRGTVVFLLREPSPMAAAFALGYALVVTSSGFAIASLNVSAKAVTGTVTASDR